MKKHIIIAICLLFCMVGSANAAPVCGEWQRGQGTAAINLDCTTSQWIPGCTLAITSACTHPVFSTTPIYAGIINMTTCTQYKNMLPIYQSASDSLVRFDTVVTDYNPAGLGTMGYSAVAYDFPLGTGNYLAGAPPLDDTYPTGHGSLVWVDAKVVCYEAYYSWGYTTAKVPGYTPTGIPCLPDLSVNWSIYPGDATLKDDEYIHNRWCGIILDGSGAETDWRIIWTWTMNTTGPPDYSGCPAGFAALPAANDRMIFKITKVLPGDINGDGIVDINDYLLLSGNWLATKNLCHTQDECAPIQVAK